SDDDSVGRTSAGDCEQSRSGAEKKALNVHFLTSSQKFQKRVWVFFAEGQRSLPHPRLKKMRTALPLRPRHYP
ncbi:hypothetical protein ACFFTN_26270, partial [Aminobacter aganoensis]|uniref:hypothetical protein n=1 Tax=Aminobacter aganoensis TaxID=83264 RepID=UPI0035F03183